MSYTLTGTIFEIGQTETITDKFKKRDIVIETTEVVNGNIYSQFIKIQFSQKKCDVLNNYNVGDRVTVSFNLRGNKWEKNGKTNYITNLDGWKIEKLGTTTTQPAQSTQQQAPKGKVEITEYEFNQLKRQMIRGNGN